jgi:SP family myo-inositol transporter-like MFS transporter 13
VADAQPQSHSFGIESIRSSPTTMSTFEKSAEAEFGDSDAFKSEKAEHIEHELGYMRKIDPAANNENIATGVENIPVSWFVWLVAATASTAGMLFGYDTGIISAVLVYLGDDLNNRPVTSHEKELITSLCSGGAFIGAIFAGNTADRVCISLPR